MFLVFNNRLQVLAPCRSEAEFLVDQILAHYLLQKPLIRRDKVDTLSLLVQSYLSAECLVLPPLLACYSLDDLGWKLPKKKEVCSVVESTNRCLLEPIELPEAFGLNLYFRVSGKMGLGASGDRPFFTVSESSRKG